MADEKIEETKKAPVETPQEDKPKEEESTPAEEQEKILGKFKNTDEVVKAYEEAEKKMAEQGEEVRQGREFVETMRPLLDEIQKDPELFKQLDEKLRSKGQPSDSTKADTKGDERVGVGDEERTALSNLILAKFEEKYGIDKLPPDERNTMRNNIGGTVKELTGTTLNGVDLRRQEVVLENAYVLANKDKLIEKSKLEALASAKEVDSAGIPSVPASPGKGEAILTSEEADVAGKMGLTRKQYLEGKKV